MLIKASGYLEFCVRQILPQMPFETRYEFHTNFMFKITRIEHPIKEVTLKLKQYKQYAGKFCRMICKRVYWRL